MRRALAAGILLWGALNGSLAAAKERGLPIELSVSADGSCLARIGDADIVSAPEELQARLPLLLPNKKAPIRLSGSYEKVPDRCFGSLLSSLQRLGYDSISFATEQPPLGEEIQILDDPAR